MQPDAFQSPEANPCARRCNTTALDPWAFPRRPDALPSRRLWIAATPAVTRRPLGRPGRGRGALSDWPAPPDVSSSASDALAPHEGWQDLRGVQVSNPGRSGQVSCAMTTEPRDQSRGGGGGLRSGSVKSDCEKL